MSTNWIQPAGADVRKFLTALVQEGANQNLADSVVDGSALEPSEANRRDELVALAVREVRAAIQKGGVYPLSVTEDAVPPDGERHALVLASWWLVNSTPSLQFAVIAATGEASPFGRFYGEAKAYLAALAAGGQFVLPTDPTGEDYLTAVGDENPALNGVRWGDVTGTSEEATGRVDMSTD